MRAISSPARTTLSRVAYRWFTATSGDGGSRSAPGCARTAESTSPTVDSLGSSMSSDDAPSASAYEAKRRRVTVMCASASYTGTDAEGSTTKTKPRWVPGLKRSAEAAHLDVLLFLERFLDRVEEGIDYAGTILLRDHGPGRAGYLGGHTLDQIGFRHGWASERAAEGC